MARRVTVDAVDASGRFVAGHLHCEPNRPWPEPPKTLATPAELLAQFPEVVVALVTRVRCARDDRFPELKWTAFKAWTALLVERVEKGRTGVGQALAVDGLTVVADGAPTGARGRCR